MDPSITYQLFPTFFIPLLQIFQAIPEHVGFNIELKWICQMKVINGVLQQLLWLNESLWNNNFFLNKPIWLMFCIDRMGHGTATYHPTSTWIPSSTLSCLVFCRKAAKGVSSSLASTQISAPCKHNWQLRIKYAQIWSDCKNCILLRNTITLRGNRVIDLHTLNT